MIHGLGSHFFKGDFKENSNFKVATSFFVPLQHQRPLTRPYSRPIHLKEYRRPPRHLLFGAEFAKIICVQQFEINLCTPATSEGLADHSMKIAYTGYRDSLNFSIIPRKFYKRNEKLFEF